MEGGMLGEGKRVGEGVCGWVTGFHCQFMKVSEGCQLSVGSQMGPPIISLFLYRVPLNTHTHARPRPSGEGGVGEALRTFLKLPGFTLQRGTMLTPLLKTPTLQEDRRPGDLL